MSSFIEVTNLKKTFKVSKRSKGIPGMLANMVVPKFEEKQAVKNISFSIEKGEMVGFIGPNGAGKSTTIKMLSGILCPDGGEIQVAGYVPYKQRKTYVQNIGVVFGQKSQLQWDLPVIDSFELLKAIYRIPEEQYKKNFNRFVEMLDMSEFLNRPVRQLSLGQRMRADIVAALLHSPQVIFFDEPTIGVDVVGKETIRNFIRELNKEDKVSMIFTTHDMQDIEKTCDERFLMPEDTAQNKLLLSVHYYTPWDYCGTDSVEHWGSPTNYKQQNDLFKSLSKFSEQGYGVVIGEYAVMKKNGGIKPDTDKFYANLLDNCDLYDYCPVLWDCSNFYKRVTNTTSDETLAELFSSRRYENEKSKDTDTVKSEAEKRIQDTYAAAEEEQAASIDLMPADDMAIAWLMYASSDYGVSYSVGDIYDPTNCTTGVKADNVQITGAGTYTVSLDFSECGMAKGVTFSALGISNGELLFPGYIYTIDEILINGEACEMTAKGYTSSDDDKCTRVNIYNAWVKNVPASGRTVDGDLTGCSAQIISLTENKPVKTISVTFTVTEG